MNVTQQSKIMSNQQQDTNVSNFFREEWFDDFIATLRVHQLQLDTNTASKELKALYEKLFLGDQVGINQMMRDNSMMFFVKHIIYDYWLEVKDLDFLTLAFNHSNSSVLVWAVVEDDRDDVEKSLILSEARVNAKYYQHGFTISTTIVEESDCLDIPSQYIPFKIAEPEPELA